MYVVNADQAVAQKLVDWSFGPGREQVRAMLGADPVVRFWLQTRKPPMRRLSVLFEEGNGVETCAACQKCCNAEVNWVVRSTHVLMWQLVADDAPAALDNRAGACVFVGPRGCTITTEMRPALCSTFTCNDLNAALIPRVYAEIDVIRTPLHWIERRVLDYLSRRYVVATDTHWFNIDAGIAETHPFFAHIAQHAQTISLLDTFRTPLGARVQAQTPTNRYKGMTRLWRRVPPAPELDAEQYLAARVEEQQVKRINAARLLAKSPAIPPGFAPVIEAMKEQKAELFAAQKRYAERYCSGCPVTESAPAPDSPEFASVRRNNTLTQLARGPATRCMYVHCTSGAHLDVGDVAVWHACGSLPVLNDNDASCPALGEHGCSQEALSRAPTCDRFVCPKEEPGAGDEIRAIEERHRLLFDLARDVFQALEQTTDYDAPPLMPEPLF